MASYLEKKHPLTVRWFHWINFPVLFIMIWSGILIYWANSVFTVTLFGHEFFKFFPDWVLSPSAPGWLPHWVPTADSESDGVKVRMLWDFKQRLAEGMAWHFFFAWIFAINGLLYVLYNIFSGQWRFLVPGRGALKESILVVLKDVGIYRKSLPERKYNAAQQFAYTGVVVMGLAMLITGVSIYKPSSQSWLTQLIGGYSVARFVHFWTTLLFLGFFVVHIVQVIRAGWPNFRGMITGYEIVKDRDSK